ncbi:MAG: PD-(D/E)XK nuclease domain-containing protein [Caldilineaceae bacterium]
MATIPQDSPKYHLRWVIEFKYYFNSDFAKFKTTIAQFQLQAEDTAQINGYVEGLRQEFPRAHIERYVIYCIGNQGFRVCAVTD